MNKQYKMVKFRLSSWNSIRKSFKGKKEENFSDYIERLAQFLDIQASRGEYDFG